MQIKYQYSLNELPTIVQKVYNHTRPNRVFCLSGEMGAGKTTFVGAICEYLGIKEPTSSPTYSLVQQYEGEKNGQQVRVFHLDLFRLKSLDEALDIGITDILDDPNALIFIEWHDLIAPILPNETVFIHIEINDNSDRFLTCAMQPLS